MNRIALVNIFVFLSTFLLATTTWADVEIEPPNLENSKMSIFGTTQMLGLGQHAPDTVKDRDRVYLFLQQARLGFKGHIEDYKFFMQLAFGGENMTPGTANPAFTLLDMNFDVPVWDKGFIRIGQFKSPYGAEFLTPDNERLFTESSIANLNANFGREVGFALASKSELLNTGIGVFSGGGENTSSLPIHALPEKLGVPLIVGRLGIDNTDSDVFVHRQAKISEIDKTQWGLYMQAGYERDSIIGHSSVMNIKAGQANMVYQQNLLFNAGWNPFLTTADRATVYGYGLNGFIRFNSGDTIFTGEFQTDGSSFTSNLGSLKMYSARLQATASRKPWEMSFRVASLFPDSKMGPAGFAGTIGAAPFYEATPAISYYFKDWSKMIFEFQGLINVPVAHEPNDGAYVLSDMPSQTTYSSGGSKLPNRITRNFVPEFKLMWQLTF
jgi:hypothetical protein